MLFISRYLYVLSSPSFSNNWTSLFSPNFNEDNSTKAVCICRERLYFFPSFYINQYEAHVDDKDLWRHTFHQVCIWIQWTYVSVSGMQRKQNQHNSARFWIKGIWKKIEQFNWNKKYLNPLSLEEIKTNLKITGSRKYLLETPVVKITPADSINNKGNNK